MSQYTTDDCVALLDKWSMEHHKGLGVNEWKRAKKSKNSLGQWVRQFENRKTKQVLNLIEFTDGLHMEEIQPLIQFSLAQRACGLYDASGEKLRKNSPEETIKYYMGVSTLICLNSHEKTTDDDGTDVTGYFYVDDDTGRDYGILIYQDGSWVIESD
jgi:hypothetical protein